MLLQWLMSLLKQTITGSFRQRLGIIVAITVFIAIQLLIFTLASLPTFLRHQLLMLELWSIGIASCCWLLTWLSARQLTQPLLALGKAIELMQRGETVTIPQTTGRDEVAQLTRQLTELVASWSRQQEELKTFNLILEEMIEERMVAVETINKKLKHEIIEREHIEQALQLANQELQRQSLEDGLTGIANRRCFDERLEQEWKRAIRTGDYLSVLLLDVDFFKQYNDIYGHQRGDKCLQQVAQAVADAVQRPTDVVARYGGEEFVVILPETNSDGAKQVAERIRQRVLALAIAHSAADNHILSVSIGVATASAKMLMTPQKLIRTADNLLYQAKEKGRNRVEVATVTEFSRTTFTPNQTPQITPQ